MMDKMFQTGNYGLWNLWISPRDMELLPIVTIRFGAYCVECYIQSRATMVIYSITQWFSAAFCPDPYQHFQEWICTDRGCNDEAIAVTKYSQFSLGLIDINKETRHNVGHCLQYESQLSIVWGTTCFRRGWSPLLFRFWYLIKDDRSWATIVEQGKPRIGRTCLIIVSLRTAVCLELRLKMISQITRWHASWNQHMRTPQSRGLHWETTYYAWRMSYSWRRVHSQAVSV